jgi:dTDP-4-amino-4,6-dideoxygalactose transaminase
MQRILELKRRHGFRLIEDAAHAIGARYQVDGRWWRVGEHPEVDATCLSFHPVKHVTTGEGGAVLCSDRRLASRLARLRSHGVDRGLGLVPFEPAQDAAAAGEAPPWFGPMVELGLNSRLSELHAALGRSQLAKLPSFLAARREIARRYHEELACCHGVELLRAGGACAEHAWHLCVMRVAPERRDELMRHLHEEEISTQLHFYPVPLQPWYREADAERRFPRAIAHARSALSLPIYPTLSADDQERVIEALRRGLVA